MNPFAYLVDTLIFLFTLVLMLRLLLQWVRADFYNPVSQFTVKVTNPVVIPLRRIIPGFGGIDIATLLLIFVFTAIRILAVYLINGFEPNEIIGIPLLFRVLFDVIDLLLNVFLFAIFIQAILSWVNPDPYNPVASLLHSLTTPVLSPIRRIIPSIGGIDISPIFAIIAIMFIKQSLNYFF